MRLKVLFTLLVLFGLSFAVTAQDDFPEDMLEDGDIELLDPELVLEEDFSDEDAWEFYEDNVGSAQVDEDDEVYLIEVEYDDGPIFLWGQDSRIFGDTVIQIETDQLSREENNGYGIMCRADPSNNGLGYRFYISGDGYATIITRLDGEIDVLYEWTLHDDIINTGRDDNELVVVCVEEYLALYVNGELIAEVEDDTYDEGVIALAASIFEEDKDAEIAFDDLLVWEVEAGERGNGSGRSNTSTNDIDVDDLQDDVADMLEDGDVEIDLEDVLMTETWDDLGDWEEYEEDDYEVELDDDTYIVRSDEDTNLIWALNRGEDYDDIVMHVEIEHLTNGDRNGFGVMCRVDPDNFGDGYSFIVRGNGTYGIGYWEDSEYTSLLDDDDDDFASDRDIDEDDSYTMTAVCVGEYLALYIDGELIDEIEDDTYDEGLVGVAVINFEDGVEAAFDNLVIWEGDD